jgi:hypothetical protein
MGRAIAATISTQTNIGDLFMIDAKPRQITHLNQELFSDIQQSEPARKSGTLRRQEHSGLDSQTAGLRFRQSIRCSWRSTADRMRPTATLCTHEFQWMAAKGYVVLFTNPRGSTSYGQEFGDVIQYHYPGDDYKDLMAGVDELLKRGYVDANRMGVTGGSGGGLLTNWTITQTQRFKAAVAQRDIADWYGFWFTADFWLAKPTWFLRRHGKIRRISRRDRQLHTSRT